MGVLLYLPLSALPLAVYLGVTALLFTAGVWLCAKTSKDLGVHDHGGIVWDEVVGYLITMIALPREWLWIACGFLLFRFFDIVKPWPIRWLDRHVGGGLGIMLDDLVAGLFALILLQLALRLL